MQLSMNGLDLTENAPLWVFRIDVIVDGHDLNTRIDRQAQQFSGEHRLSIQAG